MSSKSWVFALPTNKEIWVWNESKQDYTPRTISTKQAQEVVAETKRALAYWTAITPTGSTPYRPPVLREHLRSGSRFGSIVDCKVSGSLDKRGIYILIDWLDSTFDDIESYKSQHVSIGICSSYRDGTGEVFGSIIDELSLTEHPRLRGIGSIQDTLSLRLSDVIFIKEENKMSEEEFLAMAEQYNVKLGELSEMIVALKAEVDALKAPSEDAPVEASDEVEEEELEASDADSEDEEAKLEALAAKLSDKVVAHLQGMRLGERPNAPAPSGKRPVTPEDKLKAAKASGLSGIAAINAALK